MNINLSYVIEFLKSKGINWQEPQWYSREYLYSYTVKAYGSRKASHFNDIKCLSYTIDDCVILYTGNPEDVKLNSFSEKSKNFIYLDISETSFKLLEKEVGLSGFGDIDSECYSFKVSQDFSKDWIKFMLQKEGATYKNYLTELLDSRKNMVKENLAYTCEKVEKDIEKLKKKRLNAIEDAKQQTKSIDSIKTIIENVEKEIQK